MFPSGEYDYVFNIDHDGRKLLLPYNDGESSLEVAEKFLAFNEISKDCINQVMAHIKQNSRNVPFKPKWKTQS